MKKLATFALVLGFVLFANILTAQDEIEFKNYNMISGFVEYKLSGVQSGTQELYFEEYGKYEAKYSKGEYDYMGQKGTFNQVSIITPEAVYSLNLEKSQGIKSPAPDYSKIIEQFELENGDFEKVQEQTMKEQGFIKKGTEKVLDKDCVTWELEKNGANVKIWLWKGIELKVIQSAQGLTSSQEAIKIIEEEAIPFVKFEVPDGITWLDPQTGQPIKEK